MTVRAMPMAVTYRGWEIGQDSSFGCEADRRELDAETLDAAAAAMARPTKRPFVVLETDDSARDGKPRHKLHFFIVKARKVRRFDAGAGYARVVAQPYAVQQGTLAMDSFYPRRRFDALKDEAVSGRQPQEPRTIEVQA